MFFLCLFNLSFLENCLSHSSHLISTAEWMLEVCLYLCFLLLNVFEQWTQANNSSELMASSSMLEGTSLSTLWYNSSEPRAPPSKLEGTSLRTWWLSLMWILSLNASENVLSQSVHGNLILCSPSVVCFSLCLLRWSLRLNCLLHSVQANFSLAILIFKI